MIVRGKAGIAWYEEKDYAELRSLFADGAEFPDSYDEWLAGAEEDERLATLRGLEIVRVVIEPAPFAAWCKLKKIRPDAKARESSEGMGASTCRCAPGRGANQRCIGEVRFKLGSLILLAGCRRGSGRAAP